MSHRCLRARSIALVASLLIVGGPAAAFAQTLGTFAWQIAPFCNVVSFAVSVDGSAFRLTGFDNQCGGAQLPAAGAVTVRSDGQYGFSFYVVTPTGLVSHATAVLSPASISGPWSDSSGNTGALTFSPALPASGSPRPTPTVSGFALADSSVTTVKVAPGAVDSTRIADGAVTTADLANDSVSSAKLQFPLVRTLSAPSTLLTLSNSGSGAGISATNIGGGRAAVISVSSVNNTLPALETTHSGLGSGLKVALSSPSNGARAIDVTHSGVGPGVFATSAGGHGVWGITSAISAAGVIGDNTSGEAVVGRSHGDAGVGAVVGRSDGSGYGVRGFNTKDGIGVLGQAGVAGGTGSAGRFDQVNAASPADVLVVSGNGTGDLIQATQSGLVRFRVTNTGAVQGDGAYTSPAADVAEFVDAVEPLAPGDVVEIDTDAPGQFRLATHASSRAVAGVITTRPGVLLNATDERNDVSQGPALALAGRVPVKVSGDNGAIAPGDLLVSSSVAGHAMKAPAAAAQGTVIGKALGVLASGTGVIEMLVMLR